MEAEFQSHIVISNTYVIGLPVSNTTRFQSLIVISNTLKFTDSIVLVEQVSITYSDL